MNTSSSKIHRPYAVSANAEVRRTWPMRARPTALISEPESHAASLRASSGRPAVPDIG